MTQPELAIIAPEKVGRVYQLPNGGYEKEINMKTTVEGLTNKQLFPSITNVIGRSGKDFSSYHRFMSDQQLRKQMKDKKRSWTFEEITQILDAGKDWANYSAGRGTALHSCYENYVLTNPTFPYLPTYIHEEYFKEVKEYEAEEWVKGFLKFCRQYKPVFHAQEITVYGNTKTKYTDSFDYAGTTDAILEIDGQLYIADWKNSSSLHNTVSEQLNAVRMSTHRGDIDGTLEEHDIKDYKMIAVRFFVNEFGQGDFEVQEATPEGWGIFRASRAKWEHNTFEGTALTKW